MTTEKKSLSHKSSESVSFRVDKDVIVDLRREAEQNKISLNTLANQVFDFHVKFTSSAKADMIPVFKVAVVELLEGYTNDEIKAMAQRLHSKVGIDVAFQLRGR